jgi:Fe-S cluster assembly protein SufD
MDPVRHHRSRFEAFAAERARGEPSWLGDFRREAFRHFAERGFPTTRLEEWKYTNVSRLARTPFEPAPPERGRLEHGEVEELSFPVFACSAYVFVNGHFDPALSAPRALSGEPHVRSLAELRRSEPERLESLLGSMVDTKEHAFAALNAAFLDDGAVVSVPPRTQVEQPLHLIFVSTGASGRALASHPRVLIELGEGSRAVVIQDHVSLGEDECLTNAVVESMLGANASLDLVLFQRESDATSHFSNLAVRQERDSRLTCHTLTLGGSLVRNDAGALLADEGAECHLRGLFLGAGDRTVDNHTLVDHAVPHGTSRELYKGILTGRARGVFRGRVVVRPDAIRTDAEQSNPNLLLSAGAEIDTKPQLEIYCNDVRCSHGSTIGRMDPDALFYLRSRGLSERAARGLLTQGFANEITAALPVAPLGARALDLLVDRLRAGETEGRSEGGRR